MRKEIGAAHRGDAVRSGQSDPPGPAVQPRPERADFTQIDEHMPQAARAEVIRRGIDAFAPRDQVGAMFTLERLLDGLSVTIEPFAL